MFAMVLAAATLGTTWFGNAPAQPAHALPAFQGGMSGRNWSSPSIEPGAKLVYVGSVDGVYVYTQTRRPQLVGFLYVGARDLVEDVTFDAAGNRFALTYGDNAVFEYAPSPSGYVRTTTFSGAIIGSGVTVASNGSVYLGVGDDGILEYAATGGNPDVLNLHVQSGERRHLRR